jgi:hypothetical protein
MSDQNWDDWESEPTTFVCDVCGLEVPNSEGGDDDMPGACDKCWCDAHPEVAQPWRVPLGPRGTQIIALRSAAWRLALFAGSSDWEMCDGTPVDLRAMVQVMLDAADELEES